MVKSQHYLKTFQGKFIYSFPILTFNILKGSGIFVLDTQNQPSYYKNSNNLTSTTPTKILESWGRLQNGHNLSLLPVSTPLCKVR